MVVELADYMGQRERTWKMSVEALREHDLQKMERAKEVMKVAEVMAKKMSEQ